MTVTLSQAIENFSAVRSRDSYGDQITLSVVIEGQGHVGGTPRVPVERMLNGFDWDAGHLLLVPERPLTALSEEDVAAIRQSVKLGQSWHAYQAYKRQADRIAELEAEVARLREAAGGASCA